jgi:uncharacterized protein YjiS (DUF1127 family)
MISIERPPILRPDQSRSNLIDRLGSGILGWWRRYSIRRARRATIDILHRLDDRALEDIGLRRSEIERIVYDDKVERLLR